jgi:hypothetical protein
MSDRNKSRVIVLRTGLFPDQDTVRTALEAMAKETPMQQIDLEHAQMDQAQWDRLLEEILAAQKVITI